MNGQSELRKAVPVDLSDPDGKVARAYHVTGTEFYLPPFPNSEERFQQLPYLQARKDDILVCGYAKCGTHWVWEITGMLVQGKAEYITAIKESVMVEGVTNCVLDSLPSPRVMNTHITPTFIPKDFIDKKCKVIYLLRNPKDMLVSLYNHMYNLLPFYGYEGTWNGYFELFMEGKVDYGSWFKYVREWEDSIKNQPDWPVHVVYYEDMKSDPEGHVEKLAAFLGKRGDSELFTTIAEKCSFKNMKQAKSSFDDEVEKADWRDGQPMMYRKGQVGDWKNWFTISQNERFEAKLERDLAGSNLKFTYVL